MLDMRPVGYVVGSLVATLGAAMLLPMLLDLYLGNGHWFAFFASAVVSLLVGSLMAVACANGVGERLSIQQTFLLTNGVWIALPIFGALPFIFGATEARLVDAFFEAMSGLTTTGSTVFGGLDTMPKGILLWRGLLQWFGGIGIIVVAMVFLPELRIGGMQIFRSEGFDTQGKVLPRATQIAARVSVLYVALTVLCALAYSGFGMNAFDAIVHAMTTIATGGFANYDASFGAFNPGVEYVAVVFMALAALPFVRYVQLMSGATAPVFSDAQVRGFAVTLGVLAFGLWLWIVQWGPVDLRGEAALRKTLFNVTSILTGTGYASADYMQWGSFPIAFFFLIGLIGGCAGSTSCSIKIFRFQLLIASVRAQVKMIHSPSGIFEPRYDGRTVSEDVLSSVMGFFVFFIVSLGVIAVLLGATGLDFITSVSGAGAALANIGPGLGPVIGPAGSFAELNDAAKWILAAAMLIGRLELLVLYAIFTRRFWQG